MKVLCSAVLAIEAVVILLATSLATSAGSVSSTTGAWIAGLVLMTLLFLAIGTLRRPWGVTFGWILQGFVLASGIVVGWSMIVVGGIFVLLWYLAIRNGGSVDELRAQWAAEDAAAEEAAREPAAEEAAADPDDSGGAASAP